MPLTRERERMPRGLPDFTQPLLPLTRRQRLIVLAMAAVVAASRFLAMAKTLWDWDEALFCLGMQEYDVTAHHPHPPGFPLYVGAAKLLRVLLHDDFRSLQAVNLIASVLVFPALFFLARELRLRFETCLIAATLFSFFPNVWFFGGTAFSDVPSIVLVVFAVALYFRGCRDGNAYLIATLLLALAIGIRPQNLLVGIFPGALASWHRIRRGHFRDVVFAFLVGASISLIAYASAMHATEGFDRYRSAIKAHGEYIAKIDSFRAPSRPPLWRLFDRFFIKQYQSTPLGIVTSIFVIVSVVGAIRQRDRSIGYIALAFAPFAIAAWLMLDRFSISRFSIGYIPLFAILAADGIGRAARDRPKLELGVGFGLIAAFILWTFPALTPVRTEVSPTVAALRAMHQHVDPRRDDLFVAFSMVPYMEYFAPTTPFTRVLDERAMPLSAGERRPILLTEIDHTNPPGMQFRRERGHLWNIARRHYFEVALAPLAPSQLPQFVSGWYPPERPTAEEHRWTTEHAVARLPGLGETAKLRLHFRVPEDAARRTIEIVMNGKVVDRIEADNGMIERDWELEPAPNGAPNVLELRVSKTVDVDGKQVGVRVRYLSFGPDD